MEFVDNYQEIMNKYTQEVIAKGRNILYENGYAITKNYSEKHNYQIKKILAICTMNNGNIGMVWIGKDFYENNSVLIIGKSKHNRKWKCKVSKILGYSLTNIPDNTPFHEVLENLINDFNYQSDPQTEMSYVLAVEYLVDKDATIGSILDNINN